MIGPASNTRQKDETRRYDGSDYELTPLTRDDYREMAEAGISCVRVSPEQAPWANELGLYYWGSCRIRSFYIAASIWALSCTWTSRRSARETTRCVRAWRRMQRFENLSAPKRRSRCFVRASPKRWRTRPQRWGKLWRRVLTWTRAA